MHSCNRTRAGCSARPPLMKGNLAPVLRGTEIHCDSARDLNSSLKELLAGIGVTSESQNNKNGEHGNGFGLHAWHLHGITPNGF